MTTIKETIDWIESEIAGCILEKKIENRTQQKEYFCFCVGKLKKFGIVGFLRSYISEVTATEKSIKSNEIKKFGLFLNQEINLNQQNKITEFLQYAENQKIISKAWLSETAKYSIA